MNETLKVLKERRSIRKYKPQQITDAELNAILEAGTYAASGMNRQSAVMAVIQDKELIDRLDVINAEIKGLPGVTQFYGAPTVIFVSTDMDGAKLYARHDCGLAVENICLAAHSIGLGTVILGMPREAFAGPDGDELRKALQFPEGYDFMVAVSVGVPAGTKQAHLIEKDLVTYIK